MHDTDNALYSNNIRTVVVYSLKWIHKILRGYSSYFNMILIMHFVTHTHIYIHTHGAWALAADIIIKFTGSYH